MQATHVDAAVQDNVLLRLTNGYHGQVEGEEIAPVEEAREDVQTAHVDAAVQGTVLLRPTYGYHGQVEGEEVTPGEEAREDVQAAHVDAAVQGQQDKQASCIHEIPILRPVICSGDSLFLKQKFAVALVTSILSKKNTGTR